MFIENNMKTWGLTLKEFNEGTWGTAVGSFKVPNSLIERFRAMFLIFDNNTYKNVKTLPKESDLKNPINTDKIYIITENKKKEYNHLFIFDSTNNEWIDKGNKYSNTKLFDEERAFTELCQTYINALITSNDLFTQIEFKDFPKLFQKNIRFGIYNAIEFATLNRQVWEKVNNSSVSSPNFNMNVESTNWLLSSDMLGLKSWNYIVASGLHDMKIVGDSFVGRLISGNEDCTIIKEWNALELGVQIGENIKFEGSDHLKAIEKYLKEHTTLKPKAYDYLVFISDFNKSESVWKFIGGYVVEDIKSWKRVDTKLIKGVKYLIWKDYILASSEGQTGKTGRAGKDGKDGKGISKIISVDHKLIITTTKDEAKVSAKPLTEEISKVKKEIINNKKEIDENLDKIYDNQTNITKNSIEIDNVREINMTNYDLDRKGLRKGHFVNITVPRGHFVRGTISNINTKEDFMEINGVRGWLNQDDINSVFFNGVIRLSSDLQLSGGKEYADKIKVDKKINELNNLIDSNGKKFLEELNSRIASSAINSTLYATKDNIVKILTHDQWNTIVATKDINDPIGILNNTFGEFRIHSKDITKLQLNMNLQLYSLHNSNVEDFTFDLRIIKVNGEKTILTKKNISLGKYGNVDWFSKTWLTLGNIGEGKMFERFTDYKVEIKPNTYGLGLGAVSIWINTDFHSSGKGVSIVPLTKIIDKRESETFTMPKGKGCVMVNQYYDVEGTFLVNSFLINSNVIQKNKTIAIYYHNGQVCELIPKDNDNWVLNPIEDSNFYWEVNKMQ